MKCKIAAALLICTAFSTQAANVAFFNHPVFVDVVDEGANLRNTLVSGGHTVSDITGFTLADFNAGLTGKTILVIPELEGGDLNAVLDTATRTAIASFVSSGGTVQVHGGNAPYDVNLLNGVFGYTLVKNGSVSSGTSVKTAAAASSAFASGPATITNNSATTQFTTSGLPSGAKSIYSPDGGTHSVMFTVANGSGQVVFMGWDWYDAAPQGSEDGGWLNLANLVSTASTTPTPTSSPVSIPTLSEWGLIGLSSVLAMLGIARMRRRQS